MALPLACFERFPALGQTLVQRTLPGPPLGSDLPVRQPHQLAGRGREPDQPQIARHALERVAVFAHAFPLAALARVGQGDDAAVGVAQALSDEFALEALAVTRNSLS